MTDEQLVKILEMIQRLSLIAYPHPEGEDPNDMQLIGTFGLIGGTCSKALKEYRLRVPAPRTEPGDYGRD